MSVDLGPKFRKLSDKVWVGPQVDLDDLDRASAAGIGRVICNRPDGEEDGQPDAEAISEAAGARGMDFLSIPITHAGFSESQIAQMAAALERDDETILAYCRSGTRSTFLWSLAQAQAGTDPATIAASAREAGYDVTPIMPMLNALAGQGRG